jgi:hypothetical protein
MLLSLQLIPLVTGAVPHAPDVLSQVTIWHMGAAGHDFIVPGMHDPPWQVSPVVHAFPSLQVVPFAIGAVPHAPDPVSQVATWHAGAAGHDFIVPGMHDPPWQVSPVVHAFPSLQLVPFVTGAVPHAPDTVLQVTI